MTCSPRLDHLASDCMEFGKRSNVDHVDWSLPEDDPVSAGFLRSRSNSCKLGLFFGAPAWSHAEWVGRLYPPGIKAAQYLSYYSSYFTTIELNTTHYRIPTAEQTEKWKAQVPAEFVFCPKIFQGISHGRGGLSNSALLSQWLEFLDHLGPHAGPSFLQLPPTFAYSDKAELFDFLKRWPDARELSLEFRHPSWFRQGRLLPALVEYLQSRGIGLVITDVAGRRDVLHVSISSDFVLLRFIGNRLHPSDFTRAAGWTSRFLRWQETGLRRLYLFIHQPDGAHVPEMTSFFLKTLTEAGWPMDRTPPNAPQMSLLEQVE